MRLTSEQVKHAITGQDRKLRHDAVNYFSLSFSPDMTIAPLAIASIEKYGWSDAFLSYGFLSSLVKSEVTVGWFIRQLKQAGAIAINGESTLVDACASALAHADPTILRRSHPAITDLAVIDDKTQNAIAERILFLTRAPSDFWREFEELRNEPLEWPERRFDALDRSYRIVEGMARHPEQYGEKVLSILRRSGDEPNSWLDICAIWLAGAMRLSSAIPCLLDSLGADDFSAADESECALVKIGSDRVVDEAVQRYSTSNSEYRLGVVSILERIHSDLAVQSAQNLLKSETDREVRMLLIMSILSHFDTSGIDLARQFIYENPIDGYSSELRPELLAACKMAAVRFPEYEAWLSDSERNDAGRRYKAFLEMFMRPELRFGDERVKYPIATCAMYGPNDRLTTKIVLRVATWPGMPLTQRQWVGSDVMSNPKVQKEAADFLVEQGARTCILAAERNIGCPHEPTRDYPIGQDCPFCPYWKGKQHGEVNTWIRPKPG
jgi:hypothetical protein